MNPVDLRNQLGILSTIKNEWIAITCFTGKRLANKHIVVTSGNNLHYLTVYES